MFESNMLALVLIIKVFVSIVMVMLIHVVMVSVVGMDINSGCRESEVVAMIAELIKCTS